MVQNSVELVQRNLVNVLEKCFQIVNAVLADVVVLAVLLKQGLTTTGVEVLNHLCIVGDKHGAHVGFCTLARGIVFVPSWVESEKTTGKLIATFVVCQCYVDI